MLRTSFLLLSTPSNCGDKTRGAGSCSLKTLLAANNKYGPKRDKRWEMYKSLACYVLCHQIRIFGNLL
jgi:hypothetical protein